MSCISSRSALVASIQASLQQIRRQIELMELKPWCMATLASTVEGAIIRSPSSTTLLIVVHRVRWRIFSNSTVVHTKIGHVSKITPVLGVICHPFGKT